ncbi:MAG: DUF2188 domain-containing protein [Alphaproteobacteria bacterium]|nr:DUF2188 domain-containing protein [Alphaproteobacteria bacterium]
MTVRADDDGWSLVVDGLPEPAWTVSTKKKAVVAATAAAKDLAVPLVIETRAGDVQRTLDFGGAA